MIEEKVFFDENGGFQFDFSKAVWAADEIHAIFSRNNLSLLSDVDFVVETADSILSIEYKNALIHNAVNPGAFRPSEDKAIRKIAYKFYDPLLYIWAIRKQKRNKLIYILEYPKGDTVTRKEIRNRIKLYLPFTLQKEQNILQIIDSVAVLSIAEWNEQYSKYPITEVPRVLI